jgi:hypothetical protein
MLDDGVHQFIEEIGNTSMNCDLPLAKTTYRTRDERSRLLRCDGHTLVAYESCITAQK